jgi:hypothetical protein
MIQIEALRRLWPWWAWVLRHRYVRPAVWSFWFCLISKETYLSAKSVLKIFWIKVGFIYCQLLSYTTEICEMLGKSHWIGFIQYRNVGFNACSRDSGLSTFGKFVVK